MKKKLALLSAFLILCFATGCGGGTPANDNEIAPVVEEETAGAVQTEEQSEEQTEEETAQSEKAAEVPDDVESSDSTETPDDAETVTEDENAETVTEDENAETVTEDENAETVTEDENAETASVEETAGSHILVAYFSATGTTKGVAVNLAETLNTDIYEIVPEEPYTAEDLNYNDRSTRATVEQNDASARPAITGTVANMEQYKVVFLGYPIWWGQAPRIISTFLESYDFTGKIIVPFCTSGSSPIGDSANNLYSLTSGADWQNGHRFAGNSSRATVEEWISGLNLPLKEETGE